MAETHNKYRTKEEYLKFRKVNAEEDYLTTPISVLAYITELEKAIEHLKEKK